MATVPSSASKPQPVKDRLAFLKKMSEKHHLTHQDLATYTGYSLDSVLSWFTNPGSPRHRPVPQRAVDRLQLELEAGRVKGTKF